MTGVATLGSELASKQLDLLHKITTQTKTIAYLTDLRAPFADQATDDTCHLMPRAVRTPRSREGSYVGISLRSIRANSLRSTRRKTRDL
jgi:hypothetical protein